MRIRKSKSLIMLVVFCIGLLATTTAKASDYEGINLSMTPPFIYEEGIHARDTIAPSKDNVYENGTQKNVYGEAGNSTLYTNKCFYGVNKITGSIINESNKKLKVRLYKYAGNLRVSTSKTVTINAGSKGSFHFDELDSNTYYYLSFSSPSNFHGFVAGVAATK